MPWRTHWRGQRLQEGRSGRRQARRTPYDNGRSSQAVNQSGVKVLWARDGIRCLKARDFCSSVDWVIHRYRLLTILVDPLPCPGQARGTVEPSFGNAVRGPPLSSDGGLRGRSDRAGQWGAPRFWLQPCACPSAVVPRDGFGNTKRGFVPGRLPPIGMGGAARSRRHDHG
jgi:hypothetical protein